MATTVKLDPALGDAVQQLIDGGHYGSPDDVIRTGVRLVQERERRLAELDAAIEESLADVAAGRVIDAEDVLAEFEERYRNWPPKEA